MKKGNIDNYGDLKDMLKMLLDDNKKILECLNELKEDQKKLHEEIKFQNIVLNSLPIRSEIIN